VPPTERSMTARPQGEEWNAAKTTANHPYLPPAMVPSAGTIRSPISPKANRPRVATSTHLSGRPRSSSSPAPRISLCSRRTPKNTRPSMAATVPTRCLRATPPAPYPRPGPSSMTSFISTTVSEFESAGGATLLVASPPPIRIGRVCLTRAELTNF
jgi:hypothetical protein